MNPLYNRKIIINQTLHGYQDGHRLLSFSKDLPKKVKKQILILSDYSGPIVVAGYKDYLTGYPLHEVNSFAIAKTWYADEMQRPGCVWTHTLLIDFEDLKHIPDLSVIREYFVRPTGDNRKEKFNNQIILKELKNSFGVDLNGINNAKVSHLKEIIYFLYNEKNSPPIVVAAENSAEFEDSVIRIWSQQCSNIRTSFKFCTGAITNRKYNDEIFDLQIAPQKHIRQFEREIINARIIGNEYSNNAPLNHPSWVDLLANDLFNTQSSKLSKFIEYAGTDLPGKRKLIGFLASIYSILRQQDNSNDDLENVFKRIYELFPKSSEALCLKRTIVGETTKIGKIFNNSKDIIILESLSISKYSKMFSEDDLDVRNRTIRSWKTNRSKAIKLLLKLVRTEVNNIGENIIKSVAEIISESQLLELNNEHPELLYTFVMHNPSLAIYPDLWASSCINQMELMEHLSNVPKISKIDKTKIAEAIILTENVKFIVYLKRIWGDFIVKLVLNHFDTNKLFDSDYIENGLLDILKDSPKACLDWLSSQKTYSIETATIIASQLDPNGRIEKNYGTGVWIKTIKLIEETTPDDIKEKLSNYLLPFALHNPGESAEELVIFSFPIVHRELASSRLNYNSWKILDSMLPKLPWYRSWDKCARLRLGVIDKFNKYGWPSQNFTKIYKKDNLI